MFTSKTPAGSTCASRALALAALLALSPGSAGAAPRHDICADLGPALGVGVSSFSAAGDWPFKAATDHGVQWKLIYIYLVPVSDPPADQEWYLSMKAAQARAVGAIPTFTFYHLLGLGQNRGFTGSEPAIVKQVLGDTTLMRAYFDNIIFILKVLAKQPPPVLFHAEPDPWGFMMWAMGVEGNSDATSIAVKVSGSGHPDVAGLPDHAGGLGKAFLKLRDKYAPAVRMGWHASNFRTGTRPEVVADFYASMGEWDVLLTEQPHCEADAARWWEPWDESLVKTNLGWFSTVTRRAGVPLLLWQAQIGTTDWHFFAGDLTQLRRFVEAGLAGVLFDLRGSGNPDDFRAWEDPELATVPPPGSPAGGTAAHLRTRLAAYSKAPLAWPAGTFCAAPGPGSEGKAPLGDGTGGPVTREASVGSEGAPGSRSGEGCGCAVSGTSDLGMVSLAILALGWRRARHGLPVPRSFRARCRRS